MIETSHYWASVKERILTKLIQDLAVPASDVSMERLFSIAGDVMRPKRSRLL